MTASVSLAGLNPMLGPYDLGPNRAELVPIRIGGDTLLLTELRAERLHKLQEAIEARVPPEEPLLILPYRATYYPLLGRVSPVWGLYFTRPGEGESDMEMIRALEEKPVNWVLMTRDKHYTPGGFPKLRPEVWKYLKREFRRVDTPELPSPNYLMRRVSRSERRPT